MAKHPYALTDRNESCDLLAAILIDALSAPAAARGVTGATLGQMAELIAAASIPAPADDTGEDAAPVGLGDTG